VKAVMLQDHAIHRRNADHGFGFEALDGVKGGVHVDTGLKD